MFKNTPKYRESKSRHSWGWVCLFIGEGRVHPVLWFGQSLGEGSTGVVLEPGQGRPPMGCFHSRKGKVPFAKKEILQGGRQRVFKSTFTLCLWKTGQQLGFLKAFSHIVLVVSCGLHFSQAGECVKVFANSLAACKRREQRACLKSCPVSLLWLRL